MFNWVKAHDYATLQREIERLRAALEQIKGITYRAPELPPDQEAKEIHGIAVGALGSDCDTQPEDSDRG